MISIVNCGIGNLKSITKAIHALGREFQITNDPKAIEKSQKIILAGVGNFDQAMNNVRNEKGLYSSLVETQKNKSIKFLGICLGMQMFFTKSEESETEGLAFFDDSIRKLSNKNNLVPNIGWNTISILEQTSLTKNLNFKDSYFYFAHSYYLPRNLHTTATSEYGEDEISAIFEYENLFGCQFHPEKSFESGAIFLQNFLDMK